MHSVPIQICQEDYMQIGQIVRNCRCDKIMISHGGKEASGLCLFHKLREVQACLFLRTKKITNPTATAATITQGHHGIPTVVASHMFVSVTLAVIVMPE